MNTAAVMLCANGYGDGQGLIGTMDIYYGLPIAVFDIMTILYLIFCSCAHLKKTPRLIGVIWAVATLCAAVGMTVVHTCVFTVLATLFAAMTLAVSVIFFLKDKDFSEKKGEADKAADEVLFAVESSCEPEQKQSEPEGQSIAESRPAENETDEDDEESDTVVIFDEETGSYKQITYNKSFFAKMCLTSDETREIYSDLKNEIFSYGAKGKKTNDRISWKYENVSASRVPLVRFNVRGKTLCVYLGLDPKEYADSKYKVEDLSATKAYADYPCLYRITNGKRIAYVKELIQNVMERNGFSQGAVDRVDYAADFPKGLTKEELIESGRIRKVVTDWNK